MMETTADITSPIESTVSWQGFQVKQGERDMFWVSENGMNPMPGACCFQSESAAKKGIAALLLTRTILSGTEHDASAEGHVFWNLMELSK